MLTFIPTAEQQADAAKLLAALPKRHPGSFGAIFDRTIAETFGKQPPFWLFAWAFFGWQYPPDVYNYIERVAKGEPCTIEL